MKKSFIQFVNHASVLIGNEKKSILSDPWYSGTAFNDGWSLLFENKKDEILKILKKTSHIWISHEHPDHFSIKFIMEYYEFIKNKIFLFQETQDKRVVNFLKGKKLEVIELKNGEKFKIDEDFTIQVQKSDFYDSALIINLKDKTIFNINDCPLKDENQLVNFKKKYGECDILLSQFSYAGWKGGKNNLSWRKLAAKEKIEALKLQSKIFNSKITIPFASFIYFSNILNFYLNDSVNTPKKILDEFEYKEKKLIFLKPYQTIDLNNLDNIENNLFFWQKKFEEINNRTIISEEVENSYEILKTYFDTYYKRIMKKNSNLALRLLKKLPFFNILKPIVINLVDTKVNIYIDLINCRFERTTEKAEISMHSKSIKLIFLQDFGFDTLVVNGCFEELKKNSFLKLTKSFAIGNLNNMDIYINIKILFNLRVILLFTKKLFLAKKKLSYKLIKELE